MVGGAVPGLVVLGSIRSLAKPGMRSKSVISPPPGSLYQLLGPGSCLISFDDEHDVEV